MTRPELKAFRRKNKQILKMALDGTCRRTELRKKIIHFYVSQN